MENYTSNVQHLPKGVYEPIDSEEMNNIKEIYTYNQNVPPSDQKYLDYSIKELRTEIKRMFDNLRDVNQKTNEYIINKNSINYYNPRKANKYLSVDRTRSIELNDKTEKNNLKYNDYSYKYRNLESASRNMYSNNNNDNRYNNNIIAYNNYNYYNNNGDTFRNANNNPIIRYNNFKNKNDIIQKTNKIVKLYNTNAPKDSNRIAPNIKSIEKSKTVNSFYSKPNVQYQNRTNKNRRNFSYDNNFNIDSAETPLSNEIMNEYTLIKNRLEDSNGKLKIKEMQLKNYQSEIMKRDEYIKKLKDEIYNGPKARMFTERDRENILNRNRELVEENEKLNLQIKNLMENGKKMLQDKIKNMTNNNQNENNTKDNLNKSLAHWKEDYDKKNNEYIDLLKNFENLKKEYNIVLNNNKILENNNKNFKKVMNENKKLLKENTDLRIKIRNNSSTNIIHKNKS